MQRIHSVVCIFLYARCIYLSLSLVLTIDINDIRSGAQVSAHESSINDIPIHQEPPLLYPAFASDALDAYPKARSASPNPSKYSSTGTPCRPHNQNRTSPSSWVNTILLPFIFPSLCRARLQVLPSAAYVRKKNKQQQK